MFLNDPPIDLDLTSISEREKKEALTEKYDFNNYAKASHHCIDGFHKDNQPSVTVLP